MSLPLALSLVTVLAVFTNRILAMAFGLWFQIPDLLLLSLLLLIDAIQIPFFFHLYEKGSTALANLPTPLQKLCRRDWSRSYLNTWASHLGGVGVMCVAAMPTLGGGMWSGTFLAYGLRLKRRAGYTWLMFGSLMSYFVLYWVLDTLIRTFRYFWR